MFPELFFPKVLNVFNFAKSLQLEKKKHLISIILLTVLPLHYRKIQNHDHGEACGWAFNRNLHICEDTVSEVLSCCIRRWWKPTNRLDVSPENLIRKQQIRMTSTIFSYFTVPSQTGKPSWGQEDIFSCGCSFILLFLLTYLLQLYLKLDPFSSLYFGLEIFYHHEHNRLWYMTTLQPLLIKWSN